MIPKFPKPGKKPAKPTGPKHQSSNVAGFVYDPETNHLTVTFHGGRVYRYNGVSASQHADLGKAESKGSFLNEHIIPHHTFSRLR